MKLGRHGELVPLRGFSRVKADAGEGRSVWRSHDGLLVMSDLVQAHLPGSGEPPLTGPQWLVSISRTVGGIGARCRVTTSDVERVVACFGMPAFDEDNHFPGVTRQLWCPVDVAYRQACECKVTERLVEDGDYRWTTDAAGPCRGCDFEMLTGLPCTIHRTVPA